MSINLSASAIADFIRCSQKVLYRRTRPFPEIKSKEMIIGTIAHLALEKAWNNRDRAYEIVRTEAKLEGLSKADKTNLEFQMDMFFLNFSHLVGKDDLIEYYFKVPLYDDVNIVGKMDRVHQGNVYDWKTGRVANKLGNDVQCIIYSWAYKKLFEKEPISVCIAALAKGEIIPYVENKIFVNEVFDRIIPRMIKTIKNENYERLGMFNHSCFRCSWKIGCLGKAATGSEEEAYELDSTVVPE